MSLFSRVIAGISGISLLLIISGCDIGPTQSNEIKVNGKTMGTFYNITVVGNYPGGSHELKHDAEEVLNRLNQEMSPFDKNSTISKFNAFQSTEPFEVPFEVAEAIMQSLKVGSQIEGTSDITVGPLINAWGFGPNKFEKVPTDEEIAQAKSQTGIDKLHVEVSAYKSYLRKDIPNLYIDLSSIGEGFGADKLAELMDSKGIENYMVSIAGAIRTKGHNSRGTDWVVAIEHPMTEQDVGKYIDIPVCMDGQSIATSGSYRNFITDPEGVRKSHIIDPRTGKPIDHNTVSITIIGPSAAWSDAHATGLMVLGSQKSLEYANEHNYAIYTIEMTPEGFKSHSSRAMQKYLDCK
ncbi:MAG: FAD:protein FMN transferase [Succinivibrionaceae bacterium]|nr:FAD:protein FMN transferase [Ruminobacter sp.]MDY5779825.1 FAD:protein FMN transferase [Succinivibrionaceae bacterium]MEE1341000.1 FAD:protein FMN transferase [Succinivibrionaceae bacterium]